MQKSRWFSTFAHGANSSLPLKNDVVSAERHRHYGPFRTLALVTTLALGVALAMLSLPSPAAAQGDHLLITAVHVDEVSLTITIMGQQLNFGPGPLVVTLGQIGDITTQCQPPPPTATVITCHLSAGLPAPGDYLLTVSNGSGQSENDRYDLTIGAVGAGAKVYKVDCIPPNQNGECFCTAPADIAIGGGGTCFHGDPNALGGWIWTSNYIISPRESKPVGWRVGCMDPNGIEFPPDVVGVICLVQ